MRKIEGWEFKKRSRRIGKTKNREANQENPCAIENRKSWRAPTRFTIEMSIQSSNEFAERERERERERRALNVRDSRNESKTNIQREREKEIGKIY